MIFIFYFIRILQQLIKHTFVFDHEHAFFKLLSKGDVQLGSNETLCVRANAVLTHNRMRAHAFAFASKHKRVSPHRFALLAKKKSIANAFRPQMRATNQETWPILNSSTDIRLMFRHDIMIL